VYVSGLNRIVLLAFDARTGGQIDPGFVRRKIKDAIIEKYRLETRIRADPTFDALVWTGTQEAVEAFIQVGREQAPAK
jgi:hypothetical protein